MNSAHNVPEVIALVTSTYLSIKGTTAPQLADPSSRSKAKRDSIAIFTSVTGVFHLGLILSSAFQAKFLLQNQLGPRSNFSSNLRTKFFIASTLQILGSLLRLKCYKVLKQFFTFKLAVREDHKIIDSGPYSIVRHPSYTAMHLLVLGLYSTHLLYNPYILETRPNGFIQKNGTYFVLGINLFTAILIHFRMKDEEEMLSKNPVVGEQYKAYMKKVNYRLIPGIY